MLRFAVLLHRYLGIALGLVVTLWCLSGIVMMYVQYPSFLDTERVATLEPIDLADCCVAADVLSAALEESGGQYADRFEVEMLAGRPVLRLYSPWGQNVIDLLNGTLRPGSSPAELERISLDFARRIGIGTRPSYRGPLAQDQWTVSGYYSPHQPLHLFAGNDAAGTQWYVSDTTGEVLLLTTANQRFWNWLGAVTHWIYFTALRQHGAVWAQVVIWLAVAVAVLTLLGLYVGIRRYRSGPSKRWTPYRGWMRWHHFAGLVFGVLALTWAVSGLFSMNPWGLLESRSFAAERQQIRGADLDASQIAAAITAIASNPLPDATTRLDSSLVGGELAIVAWHAGGRERALLDVESLERTMLPDARFRNLAPTLRPGVDIAEQGWLNEEDSYYFGRYERPTLPAYRIIYADGERFYLDHLTGALLYAADKPQQRYRWWFSALHRGDFSALLRARPVWDVWFLVLLGGVTASAITGTWLGIKRLAR